jgi:hypothetical protein
MLLGAALANATRQSYGRQTADALMRLGRVRARRDADPEARVLWEQSRAIYRTLGDEHSESACLSLLGSLATREHDLEQAYAAFTQSLKFRKELGDEDGISWCLRGFALLAAEENQFERAVRLSGAATALRDHMGAPFPAHVAWLEPLFAQARRVLGSPAVNAAWVAGRTMSSRDAVDEALAVLPG